MAGTKPQDQAAGQVGGGNRSSIPIAPYGSAPPSKSAAQGGGGAPVQWLTTRIDDFLNWARSSSLWPMTYGTACCGIEVMSVVSSHYDIARFGYEVIRFSPRQADLLIIAGTVVDKLAPIIKTVYQQMPDPKWVIAMGACATSGGFYRAYHVLQGVDEIIPVDVYIPGCPPTPEGLIHGMLELKKKIERGESKPQLATRARVAKEREARGRENNGR
jgi:NADH-quinone oxidoreductase subunit B